MTIVEKLQLIRARCVELLAMAEERTLGKWLLTPKGYVVASRSGRLSAAVTYIADIRQHAFSKEDEANGTFIATCAGNAEAAWRSTILLIDLILDPPGLPDAYSEPALEHSLNLLGSMVIAAWHDELFQQPIP